MVMQLPDAENEHSMNRQQLQAKLDVAMGGARPHPHINPPSPNHTPPPWPVACCLMQQWDMPSCTVAAC